MCTQEQRFRVTYDSPLSPAAAPPAANQWLSLVASLVFAFVDVLGGLITDGMESISV